MKQRTATVMTFVVSAAAVAGLVACSPAQAEPPRAAAPSDPVVVTQAPVTLDYTQTLTLPATFEPFERALLFSQATGYLASVDVDIGDTVEAGQPLARVLVPAMRGEVASAQAALLASQAQIRRGEESSQLAKLEKDRRENLRKVEAGAIAQADVDAAAATHELAEAELSIARAAKQRAKAELTRLRAVAGFSVVHAPFSGTVTARHLDAGALARAGTSSNAEPIVEIQRLEPLRLVVQIPEPLVPHVTSGHSVEVTADAYPTESWPAKIARVARALDPRTRSMRAEIDFLNEGERLASGMSAKVSVTATTVPGALTIPSSALRGSGADRWVSVVEDGILIKRAVTVLSDTGKLAIVAGGLSTRDAVMVAGSPLAVVGQPVQERAQ